MKRPTIVRPGQIYTTADAQAIAARLRAAENEGWTYIVEPLDDDPARARVAIWDDAGLHVGYWH